MNKRERISEFVAGLDSGESGKDYYGAFFELWNTQRYYEAHDVLEQLWLVERDEQLAHFYQGLIQAAGAFVHLQKNFEHPTHPKHSQRLRPATRLFALALRNLEHVPETFHALDVRQFRQLLERTREAIVATEYKRNPFSPPTAPKILLGQRGQGRSAT